MVLTGTVRTRYKAYVLETQNFVTNVFLSVFFVYLWEFRIFCWCAFLIAFFIQGLPEPSAILSIGITLL